MSEYPKRLVRLCGLAVLSMLATGAAHAGVVLWDGTGSNDSASWAGLGGDGTALSSTFSATSSPGANLVSGSFAGGAGLVAVQCPASPSCSWTGGFTAGDTLVWAFDNTNNVGTGPLTLGLKTAVLAGGVEFQADAPGSFSAQVQAFGTGGLLGTFSLASDVAGDPVFIGAQDTTTTADIASLVFSLTGCTTGCDFAVDTLLLYEPVTTPPPIPEPASLFLLGGALAAMGFRRLRSTAGQSRQSSVEALPPLI